MKRSLRVYAVFVFLGAFTAMSYAQQATEKEKKKPVVELFEVVVVTAEVEKPESATTISEVTADQIQHRNVTNFGEALSLLPGAQFRTARSKTEQSPMRLGAHPETRENRLRRRSFW